MNNDPDTHVYLGDGLYARHDGYQIELMANDPYQPTDHVFLDRTVLRNFLVVARNWGFTEVRK